MQLRNNQREPKTILTQVVEKPIEYYIMIGEPEKAEWVVKSQMTHT